MLFGLPSNQDATVHARIAIAKLGSLILEHDADKPLGGLTDYPRDQWPAVPVVFWSFRIMVTLGLGMAALGAWSLVLRVRRSLYDSRWLYRAAVLMGPAGFLAVIAGWITTEVGRQPYTIYGHLLTAESLSPIAAPAVATSLGVFAAVYFLVFGVGVGYLLRMMAGLPGAQESDPPHIPQRAAGTTPAAANWRWLTRI